VKRITAAIKKHRLELSNLDKALFPREGIIKAELIEYYLKIAPTILKHIKGRPLTFVRYPDGIDGEKFFQKNRPDWAPDWIEHTKLGSDGETDYVIARDDATLAWLGNLASIELHQMHSRAPHFDKPDYMVFDLDPPGDFPFKEVVGLAFELKQYIENLGYHQFVKTTGGKGVHIVTPIEPRWDFDRVFAAASAIASEFVRRNRDRTTLQLKKDNRKGRVLIDIYRNRPSQTIVSPYSVRGREQAPVSMPLSWEKLSSLEDPAVFNLRTVAEHLKSEGDAWEAINAYATKLHTEPQARRKKGESQAGEANRSSGITLVSEYGRKRRFDKTPEPPPAIAVGKGNSFVIHRHHASRLHYDLRLERDGVLKSWAVPKGLPPRPGIKRLAVAVEDHPLDYFNFEGTIPRGQYGAGKVWIFACGKYEITKDKKEGFYFRLGSREINAEYRLINTKGKDWLLERVEATQTDWLKEPIAPMLAQARAGLVDSAEYLYEVKWDGIRALISIDEGAMTIRSRSGRDITGLFPELQESLEAFMVTNGLFDAEIVCLRPDGTPSFEETVKRLRHLAESAINRARVRHPAVCYLFDCIYLDGRPLINEPLVRRREWMADALRPDSPMRVSEAVDEGTDLFNAAMELGLEGVMAKRRDSPYLPGKRTDFWLKIKARQTRECIIIGYTRGKGNRRNGFGALHLACYDGDELRYLGKAGTGLDEPEMVRLMDEMSRVPHTKRPIKERPPDDAATSWIEPQLVCEVQYASRTSTGSLREPVYMRLRPDYAPRDCRMN
jgi:DNA ligase D-like protein (predicted polymerase)/DNA ligase D-like protein (predicted ligase)/DNA ligase D-like protein (predicted 3'-phosphoesterase)